MGISHTGDEAAVGADLSRPPPIYRPMRTPPPSRLFCSSPLSARSPQSPESIESQTLIALNVSRKSHTGQMGKEIRKKKQGLKNRSLHEGVGKAMTSKLSTW